MDQRSRSWLEKIKQLHALAESGLAFSPPPFDKERYQNIAAICQQMLADIANVPVEHVSNLLTTSHKKYVTPQVEVRGAVFWQDKILLVKEQSDGLWALPGGYADVGLTPVENIQKEIFEESGISVFNSRLYALRHKATGPYKMDIRDFYKLYFVCETDNICDLRGSIETSDAAFFAVEQLPPLSTGRTIERDISDAIAFISGNVDSVILD